MILKSYSAVGFLLVLKLDKKGNKCYHTCFLLLYLEDDQAVQRTASELKEVLAVSWAQAFSREKVVHLCTEAGSLAFSSFSSFSHLQLSRYCLIPKGSCWIVFSCSYIFLSWVWFLVWIWWSWNPLAGQTVSKHSGHLLADSLMEEVGRTVFMSHYPLAFFMSIIKGFFDFSFLPLLLIMLRNPIKYKKKNHLPKCATTAKLNRGPQLPIWCVVFFSASLFYPFHSSTLYAYVYDTHSQFMESRRTACYKLFFF